MDDLEALIVRHRLPPDVAADLRQLYQSRRPRMSMTLDELDLPDTTVPGLPPPDTECMDPRYEDLGLLGVGATGEVRRVRDRRLNRVLAMKVIRDELAANHASLARFEEEAQCTAQLQHPGIVPTHDFGVLPDGRVWFTMREVRGRTLADMITDVHQASVGLRWAPATSGWTFRRLVESFRRVCETVAYAHGKGVIHRDLKPQNIMVGAHGEILVVDWGLAKVKGRRDWAVEEGEIGAGSVLTSRSSNDSLSTRLGQIAGTPAYMPPEQARGEVDAIDERSDVYGLGATLYHILAGHPPYVGSSLRVLRQVVQGPPPPLSNDGDLPADDGSHDGLVVRPPIPSPLIDTCARAMARDADQRHPSTSALAEDVAAWLDAT